MQGHFVILAVSDVLITTCCCWHLYKQQVFSAQCVL